MTAPLPVLCLCGPTGAGKTAASLALAATFGGEVVNMDSRQIYRDFPLITAQPTREEQALCPHHLFGFAGPEESYGAGQYAALAGEMVHAIHARGAIPILVGGTGLYIRTLFDGVAPIPPIPPAVREHWLARHAELGPGLHAELRRIDPESAARLHPNDRQRITRALEVWNHTGKTLTDWHRMPVASPRYAPLFLGIKRELAELEPLLKRRIDLMLEAGAVEEAEQARKQCANPEAPGWSGIGCREMWLYLEGRVSLDECRALWLKNTRAYAKRQLTWFNADKRILWHAPEEVEAMTKAAGGFLAAFPRRRFFPSFSHL
jgi:tRNA dimethylallyltransferase